MSRLEEIKRAYGYDTRLNKDTYPSWLINHIEELQAKVDELEKELNESIKRGMNVALDNVKYKQALEYYAEHPIPLHGGRVARQALKGVEE